MRLRNLVRYWTAWITSLSIIIATLAPSISAELVRAGAVSNLLFEICSVNAPGLKDVAKQKQPANSTAPTDKSSHLVHCPLCLTHDASWGLLPTHQFSFLLPVGFSYFLFFPRQLVRSFLVWTIPPSRAPPRWNYY